MNKQPPKVERQYAFSILEEFDNFCLIDERAAWRSKLTKEQNENFVRSSSNFEGVNFDNEVIYRSLPSCLIDKCFSNLKE